MAVIDDYRQWRRQAAIGCRFARVIAIDPPRHGQVIEVIPAAATVDRLAEAIAGRVTELVADEKAKAASLLFPHLTTLEDTARTMLVLGAQPGWSLSRTAIENEIVGPLVALRLSREIPFGDGTVLSESLLLGDFDPFPPTRRSPITALEIFVGKPLPEDPKTGNPTQMANLAHMIERAAYGGRPFDYAWQASIDGREASLGTKNDNRAKARVTLVLPVAMARRLGCAP